MHIIEQIVNTADGFPLATTHYVPAGTSRGVIIIASAMSVPQDYYKNFATYLQKQDYTVWTFDYRGIGKSRVASLSDLTINILGWAEKDANAVLKNAAQLQPSASIFWIGHSLGGQIFPFLPDRHLIYKIIAVGSGSGYWKRMPLKLRFFIWWLWLIVAPITVKIFGYFPGKKLRKVGDLPKNVMMQWRNWCLHPNYTLGVEGEHINDAYRSITAKITSIAFTDDEYMSLKNIKTMFDYFSHSQKKLIVINPRDYGYKSIGHFGFFKTSYETLWPQFIIEELHS